jgi:hypothetical protein
MTGYFYIAVRYFGSPEIFGFSRTRVGLWIRWNDYLEKIER